jgi:hypothetical protein
MRTIAAQIEALEDEQLEEFVSHLLTLQEKRYPVVQRIPAPGDMGRDVVACLTEARLQGPWHNYQAKAYKRSLGIGTFLAEIGKLIFHASNGEFPLPERYVFVCPRGMSRDVRRLLLQPDYIADRLRTEWDKHCSTSITDKQVVHLTPEIEAFIERFPFRATYVWTSMEIAVDQALLPIRVRWFNEDPGAPPSGETPAKLDPEEQIYIGELLKAYGLKEGRKFGGLADIISDGRHAEHLTNQRRRYFNARAHEKFFRDTTMDDSVEAFHAEIYDGVEMIARNAGISAFDRVEQTMSQAARINASGVVGRHALVGVRQGACHILVNKGRLSWHW